MGGFIMYTCMHACMSVCMYMSKQSTGCADKSVPFISPWQISHCSKKKHLVCKLMIKAVLPLSKNVSLNKLSLICSINKINCSFFTYHMRDTKMSWSIYRYIDKWCLLNQCWVKDHSHFFLLVIHYNNQHKHLTFCCGTHTINT